MYYTAHGKNPGDLENGLVFCRAAGHKNGRITKEAPVQVSLRLPVITVARTIRSHHVPA
jgi:hypothetical protein